MEINSSQPTNVFYKHKIWHARAGTISGSFAVRRLAFGFQGYLLQMTAKTAEAVAN